MFKKVDTYLVLSDENRFYFTGFKSSFGCVILAENEKFFITDPRYAAEARKLISGFTVLTTVGANFYDDIVKVLKKVNAKVVGYEDEYVTVAGFKKLKSVLDGFTLKPASADFNAERIIKTEDEIKKIAAAEVVTQKALLKTLPLLKYGVTEKDISNEITYQMLSLGAEGLAFENIVAFGVNTANPHHHPSMKKLEKNDMVTFDIGAKVNGYCGDMTRTFCMGTPIDKLAKIHQIVLEAQAYALNNIKAGMTGREAHLLAGERLRRRVHSFARSRYRRGRTRTALSFASFGRRAEREYGLLVRTRHLRRRTGRRKNRGPYRYQERRRSQSHHADR